jgi:hypothetical protein
MLAGNTLLSVPLRGHGVGPQAANLIDELEAQRSDRQPFPDLVLHTLWNTIKKLLS